MREKIIRTSLDNGTRVIFLPRRETDAATFLVAYACGSRHEGDWPFGLAHFIEHMTFKGTPSRPSATAITREFDDLGAYSNAGTAEEYTAYYATMEADHLEAGVAIIADMLMNPLFREEDIESERKVIVEEARRYLDDNEYLIYDLIKSLAFSGAMARPIVGTVGAIEAIRRDDLAAFRERHYVPEKTVIVVAGRFSKRSTKRLLERTFGRIRPSGRRDDRAPPERRGSLLVPRVLMHRKDEAEQAHVNLSFRAYPLTDPRQPALTVMNHVLGGLASSRLYERIREEHGLAYAVGSSEDVYTDAGQVLISAGLNKEALAEALDLTVVELNRLRRDGVTADELQRAKNSLRGSLAMEAESSYSLAFRHGLEELLCGRVVPIDAYRAQLQAVTADQVLTVARDVFRRGHFRLAVVSPFDDPAPYLALAEKLDE